MRDDVVCEGSPKHQDATTEIKRELERRGFRTELEQWGDDRDLQTYINLLRNRPCDLKKLALGHHGQFLKERASNPFAQSGLLEKPWTHEALVITGDVLRMAALQRIACIYDSAVKLLKETADSVLKHRMRRKEHSVPAAAHAYA